MDGDDISTGDSGASHYTPKQCSQFRQGEHILIKGKPCKISELSTSKTGKHGHAKVHIVALDIFTSKKLEELCPSTHCMMAPTVTRKEYQVLSHDPDDDDRLSLMDSTTCAESDLSLTPNADILQKIIKIEEEGEGIPHVVVQSYMDQHAIISVKKVD